MAEALATAIREHSKAATLPNGEKGKVIDITSVAELSKVHATAGHVIEAEAIRAGVIPTRYLRSMDSITADDQITLLESRLAQVGLGGLGGTLLELFLRLGIGQIHAADGDHFEESNLNRQILSSPQTLNKPKAEAAAARGKLINPSVSLKADNVFLTQQSLPDFLKDVDIVIDALGGLETRLALQKAASNARIPMVTGALAGWTGYVSVVLPGKQGPADLMGRDNGAEEQLGCPAPAVTLFASIMATEAVKVLTGKSSLLTGSMLIIDLQTLSFDTVSL